MDKSEIFQNLEEIVDDPLFIGDREEDIDKEISNNTWSISISKELATELNARDFMSFFEKVISNRREQIKDSKNQVGMLFYVWFDWQAAQLRFNLISDIDSNLPFGCKVKILYELEPIIEEFLRFPYHDGFPVEEVSDDDEEIEEEISLAPLKVYLYKIS